MSKILQKVTQDAFTLSKGERASLAHALIHSLDDEYDAERDHLWDAEIKRRVDLIDSGEATGKNAKDIFTEIERRFI